jgi:signal transduction histidine kinase
MMMRLFSLKPLFSELAPRKVSLLLHKRLQQEIAALIWLAVILFSLFIIMDYATEYAHFDTLLVFRLGYILPTLIFLISLRLAWVRARIPIMVFLNLVLLAAMMSQIMVEVDQMQEYAMGVATVFFGVGVFIIWPLRYMVLLSLVPVAVFGFNYAHMLESGRGDEFILIMPFIANAVIIALILTYINYRGNVRKYQLILTLNERERTLRRQNKQLQQLRYQREEVERIIRHDLKTPLTSILAIPQLLLGQYAFSERHAKFLVGIESAGKRMLSMINMSLDLQKMESGTYQLKPVEFDLKEIIEELIEERAAESIKRNLTIYIEPESETEVCADPQLTYTLLGNLLMNAVDASPDGETIEFTLSKNSGLVQISLTNRGEVPEAIRSTFFNKYVTSGKSGGTGLGTYSARLYAEAQGGSCVLNSSTAGQTTIVVMLPQSIKP